jgi:hypothetical protein
MYEVYACFFGDMHQFNLSGGVRTGQCIEQNKRNGD